MNDIMNIQGIECYEKDGVAYLKLETVARGLGFTEIAASGNECVRWRTVRKYLAELSIATCCDAGSLPDFIPENIFYRLAMKAKNAVAEAFQAKIADEVIPSIRKHGGYIAGQETMTPQELMAQALVVAKNTLDEREARIAALQDNNIALQRQVDEAAPMVLFAKSVTASSQSILVGELAKLLKQNGLNIGQNRLFEKLRQQGYLIRRKGTDYNMPTQRAMELGLFEIKETAITHADGHVSVSKTPKITGKGQQYFVNLFLGKQPAGDRVSSD